MSNLSPSVISNNLRSRLLAYLVKSLGNFRQLLVPLRPNSRKFKVENSCKL